jgi:hypothetical protein
MLISLIVSELCRGEGSKYRNEQRAITPKLGISELWFLCIAHLPNEIYLLTKFHVDTFCFRVMSQTRKADGQTDKAMTLCSPFGEHKKRNIQYMKDSLVFCAEFDKNKYFLKIYRFSLSNVLRIKDLFYIICWLFLCIII